MKFFAAGTNVKTASLDSSPVRPWHVRKLSGPPLPVNHEFTPRTQSDVFASVGLPLGLCLGSKSGYRQSHRKHFFMPNANVFCRSHGKIWWGDLDLWRHAQQLERVARRLRCQLYVLQEMDGRFEQADQPFAEVSRRAVWHTGGKVRPVRRLIRNSGLNLAQLAVFAGVSRQRLASRQIPYIAQQINRRLSSIEEAFAPFTRHYGFKKWGHWFLAPHTALSGRSPFDAVRAGEAIARDKLFPEIFANDKLIEKFIPAMIAGMTVTFGGGISLRWPIHESRR